VGENREMYKKMEDQKYRIDELLKEQYNFELSSLNLKTRQEMMSNKFLTKAKEFDELTSLHQIIKEKLATCEG
jgi:hypothetical protein